MKICPLPFINCKSMFKILPTNLKLMWPNLSNVVLNNNVIGKILKLQPCQKIKTQTCAHKHRCKTPQSCFIY